MANLNFTGMVFVNTNEETGKQRVNFSRGHKNEDGTYRNASMMMQFNKNTPLPENRSKIKVTSGILDHFKGRDGQTVWYYRVFDFEPAEEDAKQQLDITFTGMVFKNVNEDTGRVSYRTTFGHKNADGTYENAGIQVRFNKDVELPERAKIEVTSGTLDHYKNKDGHIVWFVRVFEFKIVE